MGGCRFWWDLVQIVINQRLNLCADRPVLARLASVFRIEFKGLGRGAACRLAVCRGGGRGAWRCNAARRGDRWRFYVRLLK
uniref:Uncharacterized protein n=1 Tax=Salmonella phage PMBT21 TaxID=3153512 RepID=A0AAU8GJ25_9CAUD